MVGSSGFLEPYLDLNLELEVDRYNVASSSLVREEDP